MSEEPRAKEILDFWEAFDKVDPLGEDWMKVAMLAQEVSLLRSTVGMTQGVEIKPRGFDEFLPARHIDGKAPPPKPEDLPEQSPEEIHAQFQAQMEMRSKK